MNLKIYEVYAKYDSKKTFTLHCCFLFVCSRVRVEYYVNENTFKERLQLYFIKNQRSSKFKTEY